MSDAENKTTTGLPPCPFCGSAPAWLSKSMNFGTGSSGMEADMRALGCVMPLCPTQPRTGWRNTAEYRVTEGYVAVNYDTAAIKAWSTRA